MHPGFDLIDWLLDQLNQARTPQDMNVLGSGFHALKGDRAGYCAVTVSRNWRITFAFEGHDVIDIDLEDYHG
jgi:toxin HigB-1